MALYSIVVPVYNSELSLVPLYERINAVFEEVLKQDYELILVDDCSHDSSYAVVKQLAARDSRVKGVQLAVNHGQQKAVLCGFNYVNGDYVITMDDDLQHPPEEIPKLVEALGGEDSDVDVVIGSYDSKKHGPIRKFGSWLMNKSSNIIYGKPLSLKLTSFRLMRRYVVDNLCLVSIAQPTIGPLLLQTTKRIINVTVVHDRRVYGKSNYSFGKLIRAFWSNILTNSDLPLKLIGNIGIICTFVSFILLIKCLVDYFSKRIAIQGWTTLVVLILMFGGLIFFSIGMLGRYMTNLMLEAKKYPSFLVRRTDIKDDAKENDSEEPPAS